MEGEEVIGTRVPATATVTKSESLGSALASMLNAFSLYLSSLRLKF